MTIKWVESEFKPSPQIVVSLKFEEYDGHHDATIYYDDVAVAYFSPTGGIRALPLETGPFNGGDQSDDIKHLMSKGVVFDIVPKNGWGEGFIDYYIQTGNNLD